jgi:hypothetical protein
MPLRARIEAALLGSKSSIAFGSADEADASSEEEIARSVFSSLALFMSIFCLVCE